MKVVYKLMSILSVHTSGLGLDLDSIWTRFEST